MTDRSLPTLAAPALAAVALAVLAVAGGAVLTASGTTGGTDGGRFAHHPTPEGEGTPETVLVENGSLVNPNADTAPAGCAEIRGERRLTIDAGREYADTGEAFGYDLDRVTAPACTRLVVTVVNHDDSRHQWMVHGLPTDTYPLGMFTIEVADRGRVTGSFVTPATPGEYTGHCSLPQHAQKGMRLPLVVTGDDATNQTTATPTTTTGESSQSAPGFGVLAAAVALTAASLLAARRRR
jgi:PGF-CTERM protein